MIVNFNFDSISSESWLAIVMVVFTLFFMFFNLYNTLKVSKHKIEGKRITKFIKFIKDKNNKKNVLYTENIILYMYGIYIPYKIVKILIKLENPTGCILNYINSSEFLKLEDKKLVFADRFYLGSRNWRKAYKAFHLLFTIISFILVFIFSASIIATDKTASESIILIIIYILPLTFGFFLFPRSIIKLDRAEELVKAFEKDNKTLEK